MKFPTLAPRRWLLVFVLLTSHCAYGQTAQELYSQARAKQDRGDFRGAIEDFDRALELWPDSAKTERAYTYTTRGNAKADMGDYDEAIADQSLAIELAPALPVVHNNRGYTRQRKGDLAGAISDYEQAIQLDPNYVLAVNNRAAALREVLPALDKAIRADDLAQVKEMVAAIPSAATAAGALGWTGLHYVTMYAGGKNTLAIGEFLLKSGANPNAQDEEGDTPLHFAGERTNRKIDDATYHGLIDLLLANKARVDERNGIGLTPLHLWTMFDASARAVEMLLDHGAPVSAKATRDGWTPLHGAAGAGRTDLVQLLLRRGAASDKLVKDRAGRTPREVALSAGKAETAELLK